MFYSNQPVAVMKLVIGWSRSDSTDGRSQVLSESGDVVNVSREKIVMHM